MNKILFFCCAVVLLMSCSGKDSRKQELKSVYELGETFVMAEETGLADSVVLRSLSDEGNPLLATLSLPVDGVIPAEWEGKAVGVFNKYPDKEEYVTFFRVAASGQLLSYVIEEEEYEGLPVFKLNGGMSPEFAVQKSLANLAAGVSQTWEIGPGGGPQPVWGTVDFLQRSIERTIGLYDSLLGADTPVENVIIGTGIPVVSYLSAATKSVFLPIQYLVSVNSIKEIQGILDYEAKRQLPLYATLGYDASMADVGVAWIKLLDLPSAYKDFVVRHNVKNVIVAGVGQQAFGESFVRKYVDSGKEGEEYADGSLYILYTQGGSEEDLKHITSYITDYDEKLLDKGRMIADWESGVIDKQVDRIGNSIRKQTDAAVYSLLSPKDMGCFYNFALDLSLAFMQKNQQENPSMKLKGYVYNEYLIAQPMYEALTGMAPVLYWQFVPVSMTVNRMFTYGYSQASKFFPDFDTKQPSVRLNGRLFVDDMKKELERRGIAQIDVRTKGIEEVWNLSDGLNAPCEEVADDIVNRIGVADFKKQVAVLKTLSMEDILKIASDVDGVDFQEIK